jgi:hypothetical protein
MVVMDYLLYDGFLHFTCGVRFGRKVDCTGFGGFFWFGFVWGAGARGGGGEGGDRVCMDVIGEG